MISLAFQTDHFCFLTFTVTSIALLLTSDIYFRELDIVFYIAKLKFKI